MPAAVVDLLVEQGSYYSKRFTYMPGGVALDLTGYTARSQVRRNASDPDVAAAATIEFVTPRSSGSFDFILTETVTSAMATGKTADDSGSKYVYDIELISPSGRVKRVVKGALTLDPEVTKDE